MRDNGQFEKYLIKRNTKDYLPLELFLNQHNIDIKLFISLMDQSQTSYEDLDEYLFKIPPQEWLTYCFRWVQADFDIEYTNYNWCNLKTEWYSITQYYKYQSKVEICFFEPKKNIPKLRLIFEGD